MGEMPAYKRWDGSSLAPPECWVCGEEIMGGFAVCFLEHEGKTIKFVYALCTKHADEMNRDESAQRLAAEIEELAILRLAELSISGSGSTS